MADSTDPSSSQPKQQDTTFLIIVGALLVLIIATLAVLWTMERRGRQRAEADMAQAEADMASAKRKMGDAVKAALANFVAEGQQAATQTAAPISRADTFSKSATVDGRPRMVFMISADAGRRIGFLPGDVIEVGQPASAPAVPTPAPQAD